MSFCLRLHTYNKKRNLQQNWNLQKKLKAPVNGQLLKTIICLRLLINNPLHFVLEIIQQYSLHLQQKLLNINTL